MINILTLQVKNIRIVEPIGSVLPFSEDQFIVAGYKQGLYLCTNGTSVTLDFNKIRSLAIAPNSNVISLSISGQVTIWNIHTLQMEYTYQILNFKECMYIAPLCSNKLLCLNTYDIHIVG